MQHLEKYKGLSDRALPGQLKSAEAHLKVVKAKKVDPSLKGEELKKAEKELQDELKLAVDFHKMLKDESDRRKKKDGKKVASSEPEPAPEAPQKA